MKIIFYKYYKDCSNSVELINVTIGNTGTDDITCVYDSFDLKFERTDITKFKATVVNGDVAVTCFNVSIEQNGFFIKDSEGNLIKYKNLNDLVTSAQRYVGISYESEHDKIIDGALFFSQFQFTVDADDVVEIYVVYDLPILSFSYNGQTYSKVDGEITLKTQNKFLNENIQIPYMTYTLDNYVVENLCNGDSRRVEWPRITLAASSTQLLNTYDTNLKRDIFNYKISSAYTLDRIRIRELNSTTYTSQIKTTFGFNDYIKCSTNSSGYGCIYYQSQNGFGTATLTYPLSVQLTLRNNTSKIERVVEDTIYVELVNAPVSKNEESNIIITDSNVTGIVNSTLNITGIVNSTLFNGNVSTMLPGNGNTIPTPTPVRPGTGVIK